MPITWSDPSRPDPEEERAQARAKLYDPRWQEKTAARWNKRNRDRAGLFADDMDLRQQIGLPHYTPAQAAQRVLGRVFSIDRMEEACYARACRFRAIAHRAVSQGLFPRERYESRMKFLESWQLAGKVHETDTWFCELRDRGHEGLFPRPGERNY